jgi:hypothetical protein
MTSRRTIVGVFPGGAITARPRLLAALEDAFEVEFRPWTASCDCAAVVRFGDEAPPDWLPVPVLHLADEAGSRPEPVELLDTEGLDRRIRGITVVDRLAPPIYAASEVLARGRSGVVWSRSHGSAPVHRVRAALPELAPGELLYSLLAKRPLALLALVQFLREADPSPGWQPPPLRASIVFDDPNLRWRRYGFIDYAQLLAHADRHDYHAAMAMIPLDAGWAHGPTVALFRDRPDRLSLVCHGNDHLRGELMGPADERAALAVTAQALRRIRRFEQRRGLLVDRVMMPPHGLCSRHVTRALGVLGFDALFAIHALPWTEEPPREPALAGWQPGEFIDGCAVLPRIPLASSRADIALRAFLDHPLVLYGHHEDVADGLEPLARAAAIVNGLGDVRWMSAGHVASRNYLLRDAGDGVAAVRPLARRVRVVPPAWARTIRVDTPAGRAETASLIGWRADDGLAMGFGASIPVRMQGEIDIHVQTRAELTADAVAAPAWRPWPRVRRTATEIRDRMRPLRAAATR